MDVMHAMTECGTRTQGLVTKAQLRRCGVSEGALARAVEVGQVARLHRAVYALGPLPARPRFLVTELGTAAAHIAHVRAALLSLGPSATACGRTAAVLHGWGLLVEPERLLEVAVPHGRSTVALPVVRAEQRRTLGRCRVRALPGTEPLWVTTPLQTVVDCALRLPLLQAVVVCDSALRARDVTLAELERCAGRLPGVRHARRLADVLALADERSGSVLESVCRVRMVQDGVTGMEPQVVVRADPELRVDFCHRQAGLVVEVDGRKFHPDPIRDQARDNVLAALGWRVLRFTWSQVVHRPAWVLAQVHEALAVGGPSFQLTAGDARVAA